MCETGFSSRFHDLPDFAGLLQASCIDLMTRFLDDIFRQPSSLLTTLDYLTGAERPMLESIAISPMCTIGT
jgi:hypothetical protein